MSNSTLLEQVQQVPGEEKRARSEFRRKLSCLADHYERTRNPLYVWEAIALMRWADTSDYRLLPSWCAKYLSEAASEIVDQAVRQRMIPDAPGSRTVH
jgi:hypothetical protein